MKKLLAWIFGLLFLAAADAALLQFASEERDRQRVDQRYAAGLPGPILKVVTSEYDGIASTYYFLQSLVFVGQSLERQTKNPITESEWNWFVRQLDIASDLDGYFLDPYYIANAHLTWGARRPEEANRLLLKGAEKREWDWMVRFFLGFNYIYFLEDHANATKYLMEAAALPDVSMGVTTLAARAAYEANKTDLAIAYLEGMLAQENEENLQIIFTARLEGFRAIKLLEVAVEKYLELYGEYPENLQALVGAGIVVEMPKDPYEGTFYLTEDKKVRTTSGLK